MFSSASDEWSTPQWLFDQLNSEFNFDLDVCADLKNSKCRWFLSEQDNGLAVGWWGTCFMNPPYGRKIGQWVKKAVSESLRGRTVVCLLPARTDTRWWSYIWNFKRNKPRLWAEVRFIKGRLKFGDSKTGAPFPSVVVVLRPVRLVNNVKP